MNLRAATSVMILGAAAFACCLAAAPAARASTVNYGNAVLADNPVAYYRFGSAVSASDSSTAGNNATYFGSPVFTTGGPFFSDPTNNKLMTLNGSIEGVDAPNSASLNPSFVTLEAWINPSAFASQQIIINKENEYEIALQSGVLQVAFNTTVGVGWDWIGSVAISLNQWQLVAATYDGTSVRLYVNGQLRETDPNTTTGALFAETTHLMVGARANAGSPGSFFSGSIDEAAVYGTALSTASLLNHYVQATTTTTTPEPATVALALVAGALGMARARRVTARRPG